MDESLRLGIWAKGTIGTIGAIGALMLGDTIGTFGMLGGMMIGLGRLRTAGFNGGHLWFWPHCPPQR